MMRRVLLSLLLICAAGLDSHIASAGPKRALAEPVTIAPHREASVSVTRHSSGELFFEIEDWASSANDRAAQPRRVRVYWDVSASRADDDLTAEMNLLQRYLDTVHPGIIDLVAFSGADIDVSIV